MFAMIVITGRLEWYTLSLGIIDKLFIAISKCETSAHCNNRR